MFRRSEDDFIHVNDILVLVNIPKSQRRRIMDLISSFLQKTALVLKIEWAPPSFARGFAALLGVEGSIYPLLDYGLHQQSHLGDAEKAGSVQKPSNE